MNRAEFTIVMETAFGRIRELSATKGKEYAGNEDVLRNFKQAAADLEVKPETIWSVYFHKHWQAILSYCRSGQVESEKIEDRICDGILYLFLLLAMVTEKEIAATDEHGNFEGIVMPKNLGY